MTNANADCQHIPGDLYRDILRCLPVPCVDVVIHSDEGILLVMREKEPARKQWWLPGGRIFKGETLRACALRKAREEVGLDCVYERIVHVDETMFDTGPWGVPVHTVNVCALLSLSRPQRPALDGDHSDATWITALDQRPLHSYVVRCLEAAGIF